MAKTARSARGEMVDFDILMIKQELASAPTAVEVARRQAFIENKNRPAKAEPKVEDFEESNEDESLEGLNIPTTGE